jgi:type IV pilus biogenesis protein CpaD/CtpE
LRISGQSWHRAGLGSNAQATFTLRNDNAYAVKDIEIACAFARRDGSHLTDRKRIIPVTVDPKTRKRFARLHVGFVNIHANRINCSVVAANRA